MCYRLCRCRADRVVSSRFRRLLDRRRLSPSSTTQAISAARRKGAPSRRPPARPPDQAFMVIVLASAGLVATVLTFGQLWSVHPGRMAAAAGEKIFAFSTLLLQNDYCKMTGSCSRYFRATAAHPSAVSLPCSRQPQPLRRALAPSSCRRASQMFPIWQE
jgi:hypothetical protein